MRWPIFFAGVLVAGAAFFSFWHDNPARTEVQSKASTPDVEPNSNTSGSDHSKASMPSAAPRIARTQSFTEDRRRILDSTDVLKTIEDVRRNGSADEKDWAMSMLSACMLVFAEPLQLSPAQAAAQPQFQASAPDSKLLAEQKRIASEKLRNRCHGVKDLSPEARSAIKDGLKSRQGDKMSTLGQLNAITDGPPGMWNPAQEKLLDGALYSDDPVLAKAAFFALLHGIDWNAPGGRERQSALMLALGDHYSNRNQSEFEALQDCRILEKCDGSSPSQEDAPAPSTAVVALERRYQEAWTAHQGARELLSIH